MNLIIVESPTKSKTISRFLGKDYNVLASYGHVRDLPKGEFGIDLEHDFQPKYVIPTKARKNVNSLKKATEKADFIILATDPDREGESIAWHLTQVLDLGKTSTPHSKPYARIVFHEITQSAIENALHNPRKIDMNLVNAQQARRILDRIVGYKLSPFLWKKVARGLSAGRVQSVAVRLVVEREREIQKFKPEEYWTIVALLHKVKSQGSKLKNKEFEAILIKRNEKAISKLGIKSKKAADEILNDLKGADYKVVGLEKKETKRNPSPPFTTSTLQQEAWKKFHWSSKFTMRVAQSLYEKGFITYHRTDSLNLSSLALTAAKNYILNNYGQAYWPGHFQQYKTKAKGAQEAHEAIRPVDPVNTLSKLKAQAQADENQLRLYDLIWRRFIASQMTAAIFDSVVVNIQANQYLFRANGQTLKFDGFLKVYPIQYKELSLPFLEKGELLSLSQLLPSQHFTQPPARYTEASLIKALEDNGIGRPSTYAPIISTIQARNYVEKNEKRRFQPTEIGFVVNDLLVKHFPKIVDIGFTAKMEEGLDKIAQGQIDWHQEIREFYQSFADNLAKKEKEVSKQDIAEEKTDKVCPICGAPLIIKLGKYGRFYACSNFPKCRYTAPLEEKQLNLQCPKCGQGQIVEKRTKRGKIFYGCSRYPECDFAIWDKPTGELCPKCGWPLVKTKKGQVKCSNPDCGYIKPDKSS